MNLVVAAGNLTRDPEMRYTPSGEPVTNFSIAAEEFGKTEFINVVCWKKTAENAAAWLKKGSKVAITGRLQTRSWEAQDGTKRRSTEVVANTVEFLSGTRSKDEVNGGAQQPDMAGVGAGQTSEVDPDDIPF